MTPAGRPYPPDLGDDPHVVWAHDRRSVGELLRDADHLARDLLLDLDGDQAAALLRTWGETVQAAAELWRSLPAPTLDAQGRADAEILTRLQAHAQRMHRRQLTVGWPGDGPADERLLCIAETFTRAAALVDRFHTQPPRPGLLPVVRADVLAARTRVIHTLHVASHGTGLAVRQNVQDELRRTHGSRNLRETRAVPRGTEALRRLEVFERLAGAYVGRRFVTAAEGEHQPPINDAGRLHAALVRWDIHAHRAIAYAPAPANQPPLAARIGAAIEASVTVGAVALLATSGLDLSGRTGAGADEKTLPAGRRFIDVHVQTVLPLPEPGWAR